MSITTHFPKEWLTDVIARRGGGKDDRGNPLPTADLPVTDCLVGARSTSDPTDRSDMVDNKAVLYRDPGFTFLSTDVIVVPEGHRMAGSWSVDGRPGEWPSGLEVGLVRS